MKNEDYHGSTADFWDGLKKAYAQNVAPVPTEQTIAMSAGALAVAEF